MKSGSTKVMAPRYFFEGNGSGWNRVRNGLISYRSVVLFLDYDGTIVPIQPRPELAKLKSETVDILQSILESPNFFVCIVTGRSIENIRNLVKIDDVSFIGNHGFEIWHKGKHWIHPAANKSRLSLRRVARELKKVTEHIDGIAIENKVFTVSIHFRNVARRYEAHIKRAITRVVGLNDAMFTTAAGKKVYEIRPNIDWDKGKGVMKWLHMSRLQKPLVIYVGDDRTDEDAFRAIGENGITISVGYRRKSLAQYYLRNDRGVLVFLEKMKSLKVRTAHNTDKARHPLVC